MRIHIEKKMAEHYRILKILLTCEVVGETDLFSTNKQHFITDANKRTLGFCRDSEVEYADVVQVGKGILMLACLCDQREGQIE